MKPDLLDNLQLTADWVRVQPIHVFGGGAAECADKLLEAKAALETLAAERERLVATGRTLLDAAERHIFGDECKAERNAFRQALASIGERG